MKKLLAILISIVICGCATPLEIQQKAFFKEQADYGTTVTDAAGNLTVQGDEYYGRLADIARKFNQRDHVQLYELIRDEASKQQRGLPNNFDRLKERMAASDITLFNDAAAYALNNNASQKCASFGYTVGSGDFNKCVYDIKVKFVQLQMQQDQLIMQLSTPAPLYVPAQPKRTTCQTTTSYTGLQTTCQ